MHEAHGCCIVAQILTERRPNTNTKRKTVILKQNWADWFDSASK